MAVPKAMQDKYDAIANLIRKYCSEHLNKEYEDLCLHALEKLCRKRPSPVTGGWETTWAAGIVHAIGANNFLFDKSQTPHTTAKELAAAFDVAASTSSAKAAEIRKMLKIRYDNAEWCLRSRVDDNPMLWLVSLNGLPIDARSLPLPLQEVCFEQKLIPYVPALQSEGQADGSQK